MTLRMLTVVLFVTLVAAAAAQSPNTPTVVFVCAHGAAKSVVAAAHFNRLASERGLPFRAVARGTTPDPAVPKLVSDGLRSDGAPVDSSFVPTRVAARDVASALEIVTFDVTLPADVQASSVKNWTGVLAISDGYDAARSDIVKRVDALLRELAVAANRGTHQPRTPPEVSDAALTPVRAIELPRVEGRIDHLAVDLDQQRLYVAALGNDTIEILDLRTGTHAKSVRGFHEPQGIAFIPDARRAVVANGGNGEAMFLDGNGDRVQKALALGDDADNVRYDAAAARVYVGYGSGAIGALDPRDGHRFGDIGLRGHPESFQLERSGSRMFVNVPTAEQVVVIDRSAMRVVATWPVTEARANYPMALDEAGHRLFIGCRRPAKVLVFDTTSGKPIGSIDIVGDTDDLFYDASTQRVYVIGGEGFVDVFSASAGSPLVRIARVMTAPGARTGLFVAEQHRLYVAVPQRQGQRAEIREYRTIDVAVTRP